jgi:5'-methylthioadenosine phosphorylase
LLELHLNKNRTHFAELLKESLMHNTIDIMIFGGTEAYNLDISSFAPIVEEGVVQTPFGPSSPIRILDYGNCRAGFLSRHGEKGYSVSAPFINYRANVYAARELGARRVISWNGAGSINRFLQPGDYVILDDYIDLTKNRTYTFYTGKGYGFIRQNPAFCPELRQALFNSASKLEPRTFDVGVYACTEGPRLETTTEIRLYGQMGADVVGMTIIPDVYLVKELEMCYASLTYISNYAEGVHKSDSSTQGVFSSLLPQENTERMKASTRRFGTLLGDVIRSLPHDRRCSCGCSMEVYKQRRDIGGDWHEWISRPEK